MNVTLIKNGCKVTTSNGLTSSLVNSYLSKGYSCFPKVGYCACDLDGGKEELKFLMEDVESWPWFDRNDPASREYLGTVVFNVDGLSTSTMKRQVISNVNGPSAGVCSNNQRELVVSGMMFALSEAGMAYGRRWEYARWWSDSCDCHDNTVSFRVDCPVSLDATDGIVELNRVVAVSGPSFTNWKETGACCSFVQRFEVTLNALDSGFYSKEICLSDKEFDYNNFRYEQFECVADEHVCGPECCNSCSETMLTGAFDLDQGCCYCRPLMVTSQCFSFDGVAAGSELGFSYEFYSGSSVLENTRVLFVDGKCQSSCDSVVGSRVLAAFELGRIPAFSVVKINGKTGRVKFLCEGVWVDGSAFVSDAGGLPFTNPRMGGCGPFSLVVESDAATVPEDARVKVCVFSRRQA